MKQFGIADDRILAAKVELDHGIVTDKLVRIPSGPGKPKALREVAGKRNQCGVWGDAAGEGCSTMTREFARELKTPGFPCRPIGLGIISIRMRTTPDGRIPRDGMA